jgi:hypothetical protein
MSDEIDPTTADYPAVERRGRGPGLYGEESHPGQRARDARWKFWSGWIYRHLVPAIAIGVAAWAVLVAQDATDAAQRATEQANVNAAAARRLAAANHRAVISIQEGRRAAVRESCDQDEAMVDALRKALLGFGVGRTRPAPPGVVKAFAPLGGLKPLTKEQKTARCDRRVFRGVGP